MNNLHKAARLAGFAFENGIRLHKDSILLFKKGSLPSSFFLSILAQEEIGKANYLEHHFFHSRIDGITKYKMSDEEKVWMKDILTNHKHKQGWFSHNADDIWKFKGKKYPKIISDIQEGKLNDLKNNSVYVGLTKKGKKTDLNGRILIPTNKVTRKNTEYHITRVNDYLIQLAEGCRRGTHHVDTYYVDKHLSTDLVSDLESLWPKKDRSAVTQLKKIRAFDIDPEYSIENMYG